jgi:hypothetical protein
MKSKSTIKSATDATVSKSAYAEAINNIQSAIQALSKAAQDGDALAKESIANLSVVMFDLK